MSDRLSVGLRDAGDLVHRGLARRQNRTRQVSPSMTEMAALNRFSESPWWRRGLQRARNAPPA